MASKRQSREKQREYRPMVDDFQSEERFDEPPGGRHRRRHDRGSRRFHATGWDRFSDDVYDRRLLNDFDEWQDYDDSDRYDDDFRGGTMD